MRTPIPRRSSGLLLQLVGPFSGSYAETRRALPPRPRQGQAGPTTRRFTGILNPASLMPSAKCYFFIENAIETAWPPCEAVITVECEPSSAEVSARAVTILRPDIAKIPVSLVVNIPLNCEPSDIVTVAVAITVPAGALSGIVAVAGDSVIAVGTTPDTTNGAVAISVAVVDQRSWQRDGCGGDTHGSGRRSRGRSRHEVNVFGLSVLRLPRRRDSYPVGAVAGPLCDRYAQERSGSDRRAAR
jgi:hypothetical protein